MQEVHQVILFVCWHNSLRASPSKSSTSSLADYSWRVLEEVFGVSQRKRPPLFYFDTPWAKGSLGPRSQEEIDLVHHQQFRGEGITLLDPPIAWVSWSVMSVKPSRRSLSSRDFSSGESVLEMKTGVPWLTMKRLKGNGNQKSSQPRKMCFRAQERVTGRMGVPVFWARYKTPG